MTPPFPDLRIVRLGLDKMSGSRACFHDVVLPGSEFRSELVEYDHSEAVVAAVADDTAAIGCSGMGFRNPEVKTTAVAAHEDDEYLHSFVPKYEV